LAFGRNDCSLGLRANDAGMFRRLHWTHQSFAVIWLVSAIAFFVLAYDSFSNLWISLPKYEAHVAMSLVISSGDGPTMNDVINGIEDSHNESVAKLEDSIHGSAKLTLFLDLLSGFASLGGFFTQLRAAFYEDRPKHYTNRESNQNTEPPVIGEKASEIKKIGESEKKHSNSKPVKKKSWYAQLFEIHSNRHG
jgi:hypothetical protein